MYVYMPLDDQFILPFTDDQVMMHTRTVRVFTSLPSCE
jgi:hypothetical protein